MIVAAVPVLESGCDRRTIGEIGHDETLWIDSRNLSHSLPQLLCVSGFHGTFVGPHGAVASRLCCVQNKDPILLDALHTPN